MQIGVQFAHVLLQSGFADEFIGYCIFGFCKNRGFALYICRKMVYDRKVGM